MLAIQAKRRVGFIVSIATVVSIVIVTVFAFLNVHNAQRASAAGGLTFTEFAVHPNASVAGFPRNTTNYYTGENLCPNQDFCPKGQTLTDIEIDSNGTLVAGYGDWDVNLDSFVAANSPSRVGVVPFDIATKTWGSMFYAGSEGLDVVRKFDDRFYIPTTDPSDKAPTGQPGSRSGYVTNEGGTWHFVANGRNDIHTFDVAKQQNGTLWTVGSNAQPAPAGSIAWKSTDNGATWELGRDGNAGDFSRHYWVATLGDAVYMRDEADTRVKTFNGASWVATSNSDCQYYGSNVVTFKGQVVCILSDGYGTTGKVSYFDGTTTRRSTYSASSFTNTIDFYTTDAHLYVLSSDGIFRTDSFDNPWQRLTYENQPASATSIAVYEDEVYLGTTDGKLLKSTSTISAMEPPVFVEEPCFEFSRSMGMITGYDDACSRDVVIPTIIKGAAVREIDSSVFSGKSITSVSLPEGLEVIGNGAFQNNSLKEVIIPPTVTNIGAYAFESNQLKTVTLPASVISVGDFAFSANLLTGVYVEGLPGVGYKVFSANGFVTPTELLDDKDFGTVAYYEYVQQHATLVPIFTTNQNMIDTFNSGTSGWGDNKEAVTVRWYMAKDGVIADRDDCTYDPDLDMYIDCEEIAVNHPVGGLLLNPASYSVEYKDASGNTVNQSKRVISRNPAVTDYRLIDILDLSTPYLPVFNESLGQYLKVGDTVSPEVPSIAGYIQPAMRTLTLGGAFSNVVYVYAQPGEEVVGQPLVPGAPNTGLQSLLSSPGVYIAALIGALVTVGVGLGLRKRLRR